MILIPVTPEMVQTNIISTRSVIKTKLCLFADLTLGFLSQIGFLAFNSSQAVSRSHIANDVGVTAAPTLIPQGSALRRNLKNVSA